MPKIELIALTATGLLVFGGLFTSAPAFAEDEDNNDSDSTSVTSPTPGPKEGNREDREKVEDVKGSGVSEVELNETAETELKHRELEEKYGKEDRLSLPPLVIRPEGYVDISRSTTIGGAATFIGVTANPNGQVGAQENRPTETVIIDPEKNIEIDISSVRVARKTPADVFLESATTGLFAMGFGAVGLGVVAGTRAIRRR
jgi:hypothetical protein